MTDATIRTTIESGVTLLELNRPTKANALDVATVYALADAVRRACETPDCGAIVITGAGERHFCSGADTTETRQPDHARVMGEGIFQLLETVASAARPVVVAARGPAVGLGAMLLIAADHRVLSANASLAMPELLIGINPAIAYCVLRCCMSDSQAVALLTRASRVPADAMHEWGICASVIPVADWQQGVLTEARRLSALPRVAFAGLKRMRAAVFLQALAAAADLLSKEWTVEKRAT